MTPLKELLWLSRIYSSDAIKDLSNLKFKSIPMCKKDFEIIVDAPLNDRDFYTWFDKLVMEGVLEYVGKLEGKRVKDMKPIDGYIGNASNMMKYIKANSELEKVYSDIKKLMDRDKVI